MKESHPPKFFPGDNIAMKVPSHEFEATVSFYRDIVGLRLVEEAAPAFVFEFGDKRLWIDKVDHISQAEVWLEIRTDDIQGAQEYFESRGIVRRDEIEPLPDGLAGFWIVSPSNIIHLVTRE